MKTSETKTQLLNKIVTESTSLFPICKTIHKGQKIDLNDENRKNYILQQIKSQNLKGNNVYLSYRDLQNFSFSREHFISES